MSSSVITAPYGIEHAAAPHGGDDVGRDVGVAVCRELWVVGREPRRKRSVADPARRPPPRPRRHRRDGRARSRARRGRGMARWRRTGETAGQRAHRLRRVQHARLDEGEERAQRAREPGHGAFDAFLLETSRERGSHGHEQDTTAVRQMAHRARRSVHWVWEIARHPANKGGRLAAERRAIEWHWRTRDGDRRGRRDRRRPHPPDGAAAPVQRGVDDLRRRARMGGAAVLPALPAPRRPLRRRRAPTWACSRRWSGRASPACASPRSSPSRPCARTCWPTWR